ncbi:hypothetical protein MN608_11947 [Microdochium nivale]|nr:hypothetical protein MN608_11947 [Microdochium nivale]
MRTPLLRTWLQERTALVSRVFKDSRNADCYVLTYCTEMDAAQDYYGSFAMHISPDKKVFVDIKDDNNLKKCDRLAFVFMSANGKITVIGELPAGTDGRN